MGNLLIRPNLSIIIETKLQFIKLRFRALRFGLTDKLLMCRCIDTPSMKELKGIRTDYERIKSHFQHFEM